MNKKALVLNFGQTPYRYTAGWFAGNLSHILSLTITARAKTIIIILLAVVIGNCPIKGFIEFIEAWKITTGIILTVSSFQL